MGSMHCLHVAVLPFSCSRMIHLVGMRSCASGRRLWLLSRRTLGSGAGGIIRSSAAGARPSLEAEGMIKKGCLLRDATVAISSSTVLGGPGLDASPIRVPRSRSWCGCRLGRRSGLWSPIKAVKCEGCVSNAGCIVVPARAAGERCGLFEWRRLWGEYG